MDMGIVAILEKRHKYHLIREILSYPDNTEIVKIHLEDATKHMKRGSIGLALGNSAHLLDVVNLIVIAWNDIKHATFFNCYNKADIIPSFHIINAKIVEMEDQCIIDLIDLLCNCNLLGMHTM